MRKESIALFVFLALYDFLFASSAKTITVQKNHVAEWHKVARDNFIKTRK